MSFDFLVFEPAVPPRTDEGFKAWYDDEVADRNGASSYDSAIADSDMLREFYAEMREVFFPFNGPDNVSLSDDASPARQLRRCEYFFRPNSLYMCFPWGAQDMARAVASAFAREIGLGYFHVSAQHGQAIFPDGTKVWPTGKYEGYGAGKGRAR